MRGHAGCYLRAVVLDSVGVVVVVAVVVVVVVAAGVVINSSSARPAHGRLLYRGARQLEEKLPINGRLGVVSSAA